VGNVTYNLAEGTKGPLRPDSACCPKEDAKMRSLKLLLLVAGLSALVVPVFLPAHLLIAQAQQCPNGICP